MDAGESGEVRAPTYTRFVGWWHVLPPGVRHLVRRWSGLDRAMGGIGRKREEGVDEKR